MAQGALVKHQTEARTKRSDPLMYSQSLIDSSQAAQADRGDRKKIAIVRQTLELEEYFFQYFIMPPGPLPGRQFFNIQLLFHGSSPG